MILKLELSLFLYFINTYAARVNQECLKYSLIINGQKKITAKIIDAKPGITISQYSNATFY